MDCCAVRCSILLPLLITIIVICFQQCNVTKTKFRLHELYLCCWLQNSASKLLLAIMESRHDSENADRILYSIQKFQLLVWINQLHSPLTCY